MVQCSFPGGPLSLPTVQPSAVLPPSLRSLGLNTSQCFVLFAAGGQRSNVGTTMTIFFYLFFLKICFQYYTQIARNRL